MLHDSHSQSAIGAQNLKTRKRSRCSRTSPKAQMAVLTERCVHPLVIQTHGNILLSLRKLNVNFAQLIEVQMALCHWVRIVLPGIKCSKPQTVATEGLFPPFFSWYVTLPHDAGSDHILPLG